MFGSHLSVAGGMINALYEGAKLGLDTVQVFTKNQRQWVAKPLDEADAKVWLDELKKMGWQGRTVSHNSYLINMASPDPALREKSTVAMRDEIERCERLGIPYLVFHPGSHSSTGVDDGIARLGESCARLLSETKGYKTVLCLENTAGGGSTLGRSLEELAAMRDAIRKAAGSDAKGRVGFCIDTCHALASGYDLASTEGGNNSGAPRTLEQGFALGDAFLDELDRVLGFDSLRVLHLNDSLGGRGSHIDRHAHIGEGQVALGAFGAIVNHPKLADVPMILETPKGEDDSGQAWDTVNLAKLRSLIRPDQGKKRAQVPSGQGKRGSAAKRSR